MWVDFVSSITSLAGSPFSGGSSIGLFNNRGLGQIDHDARLSRGEPARPRRKNEAARTRRHLDIGFGKIDDDSIGIADGKNPEIGLFRQESHVPGMLAVAADFGLDPDLLRGQRRWSHASEGQGKSPSQTPGIPALPLMLPMRRLVTPVHKLCAYSTVPGRVQSSGFTSVFNISQ